MSESHAEITIDGTVYTYAKVLNRTGKPSFEKRYSCYTCHLDFSKKDILFYAGRPYGIPCGCAKDVHQLRTRGE